MYLQTGALRRALPPLPLDGVAGGVGGDAAPERGVARHGAPTVLPAPVPEREHAGRVSVLQQIRNVDTLCKVKKNN